MAADPVPEEAQREEFRRRGLVRIPCLLPEDRVAPARELVRAALEEFGACRDGVWIVETSDARLVKSLSRKLKQLAKRSAEVAALCSVELHAMAERLVEGRPLVTVFDHPQILFTPPNAKHWILPHQVWHTDVPRLGEIGCPGIQTFAFIERVVPGGAGTVVAAGSHHYVNDQGRVRSKDVKKVLRETQPWFGELFHSAGGDRRWLLDRSTRDGNIELQVVELTGEPGDVWLMDLRLLHSLAPNASKRPRLMATQRYFLAGVREAAYEAP